jgi:hypothetical protein
MMKGRPPVSTRPGSTRAPYLERAREAVFGPPPLPEDRAAADSRDGRTGRGPHRRTRREASRERPPAAPVRQTGKAYSPRDEKGRERARRKPRLLLRLPGAFLLRLDARELRASLFQLPPRFTRFEPVRPALAEPADTWG